MDVIPVPDTCISCMKWKAQNKKDSKVASNQAKYPGERLHIDARGPLPLPMSRKEQWLKIRDEYSGYSWDYFMSEKSSTTAIPMFPSYIPCNYDFSGFSRFMSEYLICMRAMVHCVANHVTFEGSWFVLVL